MTILWLIFGFVFILGLIFFITLMILLRDYDRNKKEKNRKWYIDKILIALIPVWMTFALVFFTFYNEEDDKIFLILPIVVFICIGIIATPNAVIYALNDMKEWKNIFYKKGNLNTHKNVTGFYRMQAPVPFERKLYFAVLKDQILNLYTVAIVIFGWIIMALFSGSTESVGAPFDIVYAIVHTKATRAAGFLFFGAVFFSAFWIPIFAYYITNAVYKLRIVKRHEYIVYHAIVDKVDTFKLRINNSGMHYEYDYCSCVGIRAKNINKTKAILVFVPDDLLLFPDNEEKNKY